MTGKHLQCAGLFLATVAAFSLALGQPRVVLAATEDIDPSAIEQLADTRAGKAALGRAGVSAEKLKLMLARLSPGQRQKLEAFAEKLTPRARLGAKMIAEGYTRAEADERLALLTGAEIAKLADDPDAMAAGKGVWFIAALVGALMALIVSLYFMALEEPVLEEPEPEPKPGPPPAK